MTGSYDFYRALFKQTGIVEVKEIHEAVDFLKAFAAKKYPANGAMAVMGVSGGSAIVFADAGEPEGLRLANLAEETERLLAEVVPNIGAVHNPIDLTAGYFSAGNRDKLRTAIEVTLADPGVDALCVNLATTGSAGSTAAAEVIADVAKGSAKPVCVFSSAPRDQIADAGRLLAAAAVPLFPSPSRAAKALAMLARYGAARNLVGTSQSADSCPVQSSKDVLSGWAGKLSEAQSKDILSRAGIPVTRDVLVTDAGGSLPDQLSWPVVVKIVSPDIAHKTEIGGVKVGIRDAKELESAIAEVRANAQSHVPDARIEGVMVSEMVKDGFELIAGVVNDEVFGPVVVVGAGGIYAELMRDSSCRLAPFDATVARQMLDELRCRPILGGARGKPALDVDATSRALAALSRFAWEHRDGVSEIDVNPLFVLPHGVLAADALIVPVPFPGH